MKSKLKLSFKPVSLFRFDHMAGGCQQHGSTIPTTSTITGTTTGLADRLSKEVYQSPVVHSDRMMRADQKII